MNLWVCGRVIDPNDREGRHSWEFQGVFGDRGKALEAARGRWGWFIAPVNLDEELPEETMNFPNSEWVDEAKP